MSLITPESVWNLQKSLAAKAKGSPTFRFYSLYDKICRRDVLTFAYRCCKANGGSPGTDGQTFEEIEAEGLAKWLDGSRGRRSPKPDGSWMPENGPSSLTSGIWKRDEWRSS